MSTGSAPRAARDEGSGRARPGTAGEMLALARAFLERKGVPEARLEAELLVAHALGFDRLALFMGLDRPVVEAEIDRARELCVRRADSVPVAYLTGAREFYGRRFRVGPGVLVPRPETELVVDLARERLAGRQGLVACDVGTGSGCLAVTLALELEETRVVAVDASDAALAYARRNVDGLGAEGLVEVVRGDGLAELRSRARARPFDLVVSNPPYVEPRERATLPADVREHEPAEALFAPPGDPDFWVRELVALAPEALAPGGLLFVELGAAQGPRAHGLAEAAGLGHAVHRDLAGIERVLEVQAAP